MRRLVANALLLLFAGNSILLYLSARSQTDLPVCCRRGGKHHCAVTAGESSGGPEFHALSEKCRFYPRATFPARHQGARPPAIAVDYAGIVSHPVHHARTGAKYQISRCRSHQKRGPPFAA